MIGSYPLYWLSDESFAANEAGALGYSSALHSGVVVGETIGDDSGGLSGKQLTPGNLYADLSEATATSINNLRQAFSIQKVLERDAVSGSRYVEQIKSHFNVTLPDYTAQRPEYLGGKRVPINVTQVLQTSNNTGTQSTIQSNHIGTLGAFSNTADHDYLVNKSFNEYGILMGLICVRTEQQYSQGVPRMFSKFRRFDFYLPEFANLGEMPILNKEIFLAPRVNSSIPNNPVNDEVFGYQESWAEYRYHPNMLTGNFGAGSNDATLGAWTYGNEFSSTPSLAGGFMEQKSTNIGDTLYDTATITQFIGDFYFDLDCVRPMPLRADPGTLFSHW